MNLIFLLVISITAFGAKPDDRTDATAAINTAIVAAGPTGTVSIPAGTYRVNGQIELNGGPNTMWHSCLVGAGRAGQDGNTILHVTNGNGQAVALIHAALSCTISDFQVNYDQPDTATYGSFIQYKPTIFFDPDFFFGLGGGFVYRLGIAGAWDGIKAIGNCGQSVFDDIWMSAFNKGIELDGSLDTMVINNFHFWPFGLSENQAMAFESPGGALGLYIGRVDGLQISNSLFLAGTGADFHDTGNGPAVAQLTNVGFDSYATVLVSAGDISFDNCYMSLVSPARALYQVGGDTRFSNCYFTGETNSNWLLLADGQMSVYNSYFDINASTASAVKQLSGFLTVTSCFFAPAQGVSYSKPRIDIAGGRATIASNTCLDKGAGTGNFVRVRIDDYHQIGGNTALGWGYAYPRGRALMSIYNNIK